MVDKIRFSKAVIRHRLELAIEATIRSYKEVAGKPIDHSSGWAQVPIGNALALYEYGRVAGLECALDEVMQWR